MLVNYDVEDRRKNKMKSDDRVLILKPMEGKTALSAAGAVDKRLFNGENKLHAIYDEVKGNWYMKYDMGGLPGGLQGQFTLFSELLATAKSYFKKRYVDIVEVHE
jgi:hypothetical protein